MTFPRLLASSAVAALALGLGLSACGAAGGTAPAAQGVQPADQAPDAQPAPGTQDGTIPSGHVNVDVFLASAAREGVTIIDVRTPEEFVTGHMRGAININIESPEFASEIARLAKDGVYAVYGHSANRSRIAENAMIADGFTWVFGLEGGVGALDPDSLIID